MKERFARYTQERTTADLDHTRSPIKVEMLPELSG